MPTRFPDFPALPDPVAPLRKVREGFAQFSKGLNGAVEQVHGVTSEAAELRKTIATKGKELASAAKPKRP